MTDEDHQEPDAVTKVARDLSAIVELAGGLETQAIHKANNPEYLPGGDATVALAPVASIEAWEHRFETAERLWLERMAAGKATKADRPEPDEDETFEPPLQTLLFWSEAWRVERNRESDRRPTLDSEAQFIRQVLGWAWDNEPHFEDFADDVHHVRIRLENLLYAGTRTLRGVQCFDCNVELVRVAHDRRRIHYCAGNDGVCGWPHRFCPHDRGGLADLWVCPSCDRKYDDEAYRRAVSQAHFVHAEYLPLVDCAQRTGVKAGTIRVWVTRDKVRKRRDHNSGRMTYNVADVLETLETRGDDETDVVA